MEDKKKKKKLTGLGRIIGSFGGLLGNASKKIQGRQAQIDNAVNGKKKKKKRKTRAQILSEI